MTMTTMTTCQHRNVTEHPDSDGYWSGDMCVDCHALLDPSTGQPHTGHYSHLGGTYWCDTCDSPYCELI